MSVPKPASFCGPEFRAPLPFPVLHYKREDASYLDASRSTDMRASDLALTVSDRLKTLRDTDLKAWVKHGLQCAASGMSVSRYLGFEVYCPIVR